MIIIMEGVDGSGKSTFVELLQKQLPNAIVLKSGPPDPPNRDPYEEYERRLYPYIDYDPYLNVSPVVICDRWSWGEKVYGPTLRQHDRLGVAGWRHIELFLAAQGAVVVWLHQPASVLIDRLERRGDELIGQRHLGDIDVGYQWCLRNTILPTIGLRDPDDHDVSRVLDNMESGIGARFSTYIGSLRPRVLLFGERRGGDPGQPDQSAFVPRKSTSGRFLLESLPEALWPHVGICNALEEDVAEVWWEFDEPPVVALGRAAHNTLEAAQVPHATVPHPQYVRRFMHESLPAYGRLIERLVGTTEYRLSWRMENAT